MVAIAPASPVRSPSRRPVAGVKGNCRHQLGDSNEAHALPRVRPGPVENVLAVTVGFQIRGQHAGRRSNSAQA